MISKCLQKIDQDLATGVLIVPFWKTQAWFSVLMNLLVDNPLVLPQADNLLTLPHTGAQHPLKRKIRLIACKLSGQVSCRRMFLAKQQTLLCNHGQKAQLNNTAPTSEHGWSCVVNTNPYDPPITRVLDYLTSLFERGLRYDAINTAKSAISAIATPKNGISLGSQPLISRFMKGIFKSRPPTPRYQSTWDVQPMLSHLVSLGPATEMDLKSLTHKLAMLIALVSAQRTQSIHLLDLHFMKLSTDAMEFVIPGHIKQSRPGYKVQPVLLKAYPIDRHLCVVTHLKEYIERTKSRRSVESRLFISYVKPHKGVSKDTISRWIRTVMTDAGIAVNVFKPHSTRSAATSKALQSCVPIQDVLKQAGWSNQRTFDRFYNKPINYSSGFAEAVLGVQ